MSADRVSQRRKSRRVAVQSLYWLESQPWDELRDVIHSISEECKLGPKGQQYALSLARTVIEKRGDYAQELGAATLNWDPDRVGRLEHIIVSLALAEWDLANEDTPPKVVLNEAVTLAAEFIGEDGSSFVNGILDAIGHRRGLLEGRR